MQTTRRHITGQTGGKGRERESWEDIKRGQRNESPPNKYKGSGETQHCRALVDTSQITQEVREGKERAGKTSKGVRGMRVLRTNTKALGRLSTAHHS